jgi:hypothetical protein
MAQSSVFLQSKSSGTQTEAPESSRQIPRSWFSQGSTRVKERASRTMFMEGDLRVFLSLVFVIMHHIWENPNTMLQIDLTDYNSIVVS